MFAGISEGGYSENLTVPQATAAVPVTETISAGPPNGVTPLSRARLPDGAGRGMFKRVSAPLATRRALDTTPTPLAYLDITDTTSVMATGNLVVAFTLPSISSGVTYNLALYLDGQWGYDPFADTVSGNTLTFSFPINAFTLTPTTPLVFALYSASPGPELEPSTMTFDASAPGSEQPLQIVEPGYTGAFTGTLACTAATPSSPTPAPSASPTADPNAFVAQFNNGTASITVPANANGATDVSIVGGDLAGTCTVTVTDANALSGTATIDVDETDAGLYSIHRVKH